MNSVNSCKTYIDVTLLSEIYLKPHDEKFFIPNYHFYRTDCFPGRKGRTADVVRNGIPHADLPPHVSVDATEFHISIGNSEMPFGAVHKSSGHSWINEDIMKLLSFSQKSFLAVDLNVKHPFWNSVASNLSGTILLDLLLINELEISALQCSAHYPAEVVMCSIFCRNMFGIVSDILDSDHLPILHLLDHVTTRSLFGPSQIHGFGAISKDCRRINFA
jgi:hypothetical protein